MSWIAAVLAMAAPVASGQSGFGFGDEPPTVTTEALINADRVPPGGRAVVALVLDHAEGYHSWPAAELDVLPPEIADFAVTTTAGANSVPEWVTVGAVQWPTPHLAPVPDISGSGGTVEVLTFDGRAVIYIPIQIASDAPVGAVGELVFDLGYQACNDSICLMPQFETHTVSVEVVADAPASDLTGDFAAFDPAGFDAAPTADPEPATEPAPAAAPSGSFFGIPVPQGGGFVGLIVIGLLAALGGAVLNLTPCVLPVIPIKVMTLSQHAGESRARAMALGLWMFLGVVAFWAALAIPVLALQGFADPSRIFGIWWLTVGIGAVIAVMAVGLMGVFEITLPQKVYMVNPKADSAWGSFVFGIMTAVLGLPCFGFVAGALVPAAATQGAVFVVTLFTAMGVGMGAPYLVLAAFPGLVKKLPRTGPASELVKQVMGLLLLAAAAYFVGSGLIALVTTKPYLAKQLHWWIAGGFGAAAGLWLLYRTVQITKRPVMRGAMALLALLLAGGGLWVATSETAAARGEYERRQAELAAAGASGDGAILKTVWNEFSPALVDRALADGNVVVMDFTAEWCINCKALKRAVLDVDPTRTVLHAEDVVMVKVDLTGSNPEGDRALKSLNRTGIPTLAVLSPNEGTQPWVSSAYTAEQVIGAVGRARLGTPSARAGG
ncbi:MAG: cytochrome c biogenesis protein CcdA [Phycisphaerales bacterium]